MSVARLGSVACKRTRKAPTGTTRLRLFAESGGYCQKPDCLRPLFDDDHTVPIHVAEVAHVISAGVEGPRTDTDATSEDLRQPENLILLCPTCHTKIDMADLDYPADLLGKWKADHYARISDAFGIRRVDSRAEARAMIEQRLVGNKVIWARLGPESEYRYDPESAKADQWRREVVTQVIPNNHVIARVLLINQHLLEVKEREILSQLELHIRTLERRHLEGELVEAGQRWPSELDGVLLDERG